MNNLLLLQEDQVLRRTHEPGRMKILFLLLEDGRARLAGTTLEYSPTTGLKEVHPE